MYIIRFYRTFNWPYEFRRTKWIPADCLQYFQAIMKVFMNSAAVPVHLSEGWPEKLNFVHLQLTGRIPYLFVEDKPRKKGRFSVENLPRETKIDLCIRNLAEIRKSAIQHSTPENVGDGTKDVETPPAKQKVSNHVSYEEPSYKCYSHVGERIWAIVRRLSAYAESLVVNDKWERLHDDLRYSELNQQRFSWICEAWKTELMSTLILSIFLNQISSVCGWWGDNICAGT